MEHFSDIAKYLAVATRNYIQKTDQPEGAGCILAHFVVYDEAFVKSYFGEECAQVSYPFPIEEGGSMVSSKTIAVDSLQPYYCGLTKVTTHKKVSKNHFGLCTMLAATELQTDNSHSEVSTQGASELSGFATGYQFHKCATANICCKTTNKLLFKVIIAISTEHDDEMSNTDINNRTRGSIASITDYLENVCGEYCTVSINR